VGCSPVAYAAVEELYEWMFGTYLPNRYPTMFVVERERVLSEKGRIDDPGSFRNLTTNETVPLVAPGPTEALKTLGAHVDCDLALLLPTDDPDGSLPRITPTLDPEQPYHLHAFALCFPSGFNTLQKAGLPLASIHAPVPGYGDKLQKSMDRYFASLPFGKVVRRVNWACQSDDVLFKVDGNHLAVASANADSKSAHIMAPPDTKPSEEDYEAWDKAGEEVDPARCLLRCERQTLHRLEKTGALLFAFKTYVYPLSQVKEEGLGPAMADAVEGLAKGSVPGMRVYKRSVVWGPKVKEYLRGQ
jgi:Protein of unknown function (DUF3445)